MASWIDDDLTDADWRERLRRGPGEAMVRTLDVSVRQILLSLARGVRPKQLLSDHPGLQLIDMRACLAYAAEVMKTATPLPETCAAEVQTVPPPAKPAKEDATEAETLVPGIIPPDQLATIAPVVAAGALTAIHVPGYEILAELGRGGMGVVYKARGVRLNRIVALKMILAGEHAGQEMLDRFRREAQTAAQLSHAGVVQVYEVGEHDGRPYIVQEFIAGGSLTARLGEKPWPAVKAAELVEALARAVQVAHEHGIIHRDLKPENVLLTEAGQPKIADFGLAKRMDVEDGKTRTGAIMGTPSYMAPEQAGGRTKEIGPAADVYALGAILYRLLTGRPPFQGADVMGVLMQALEQEPVSIRRLKPKAPHDLETIALKCLAKEPKRRYASANALADDLRRFVDAEPIKARRLGTGERLSRWVRRRPGAAFARVITVLLLLFVAPVIGPLLCYLILPVGLSFTAGARARIRPWVLGTLAWGAVTAIVSLVVVVVISSGVGVQNPWIVPWNEALFTIGVAPLLLGVATAWLITERHLGRLAVAAGIIACLASPWAGDLLWELGLGFLPGFQTAAQSVGRYYGIEDTFWLYMMLGGGASGLAWAGIIRLARWSLNCDPVDAAVGTVWGWLMGLWIGGMWTLPFSGLLPHLVTQLLALVFILIGSVAGAYLGGVASRKPRREPATK